MKPPSFAEINLAASIESGKILTTDHHLKQHLNVYQGAALITGAMIGSGIFTNPGKALGIMGATLPTLGLWVLGAMVAFCGALNYAELGLRVTLSGGDAPYLQHAFPSPLNQFLAVIYSWTRVSLINPGLSACVAYTASTNLILTYQSFFLTATDDLNVHTIRFIATSILMVQTLVLLINNKLAGKFLALLSLVSVLSLVLFCVTGLWFSSADVAIHAFTEPNFTHRTTMNPGLWASGLFKVLWAYDGFANLASSLGELRNPKVNIVKSSFLGISIVTGLYMLANISYIVVIPFDALASAQDHVASVWALYIFNGVTGPVTLIISLTVMACSYVTLYSSSRMTQATGLANLVYPPTFFSRLNSRLGTPVNALVFNFVVGCLLLWVPPNENVFWWLIDAVSYPLWIWYGITAFALIRIKRTAGMYSGFSVHPLSPWLIVVISVFLCIFPFFDHDLTGPSLASCAFMLSGVPIYYLLLRLGNQE